MLLSSLLLLPRWKTSFSLARFTPSLWLKKRSLMPGLTFPRKLISCDGDLRSHFACLLYSYPENELPEERVQAII
jgi:ribonucleoside-diphosphate reductase beta chain